MSKEKVELGQLYQNCSGLWEVTGIFCSPSVTLTHIKTKQSMHLGVDGGTFKDLHYIGQLKEYGLNSSTMQEKGLNDDTRRYDDYTIKKSLRRTR